MNFLHRPLFLAMLVAIGGMIAAGFVSLAQQPESPCAAAELRAATAESHIAAWRLKAEVSAARGDSAEQQIGVQQEKLAATQATSRLLVGALGSAEQRSVELENRLAETITAKNKLASKIKKANGTILCEIFRVGCVSER